MSAQRLRDAAKVLRELAQAATPGPWEAGEACVWTDADLPSRVVVSDGRDGDGGAWDEADAAFIATMHPGVALALADALDAHIQNHGFALVAVADLILGAE